MVEWGRTEFQMCTDLSTQFQQMLPHSALKASMIFQHLILNAINSHKKKLHISSIYIYFIMFPGQYSWIFSDNSWWLSPCFWCWWLQEPCVVLRALECRSGSSWATVGFSGMLTHPTWGHNLTIEIDGKQFLGLWNMEIDGNWEKKQCRSCLRLGCFTLKLSP